MGDCLTACDVRVCQYPIGDDGEEIDESDLESCDYLSSRYCKKCDLLEAHCPICNKGMCKTCVSRLQHCNGCGRDICRFCFDEGDCHECENEYQMQIDRETDEMRAAMLNADNNLYGCDGGYTGG